jgi:NAD(P)-dependent dehydrogenase (short-subunit alcohol dehydrogenase family)
MSTSHRWTLPVAAFGVGWAARQLLRRATQTDLRGQVVLITGSSRGLGLALARELARAGCRLVLCARDADGSSLERARQDVAALGASVLAVPCDVSDPAQVRSLVQNATERFGRIDVLINNAGIISVGPLETLTVEDFERSMGIMFWGGLYTTFEVLPQMRARRQGRIVNITSIGGKVSVPHLAAYGAAKFAAVGFSEGLRAELARDGIVVTTIVPGLMRTGSHLNALFKGQHRQEFGWFSLGATLPLTSMSAEDAARRIVTALQRGEAEVVLTWQAQLLSMVHGVMPGLTADILSLVNRALPGPGGIGQATATGHASGSAITDSPLEVLGRRAATKLNQP